MNTLTSAESLQGVRPYQQDSWGHLNLANMDIMAVADGNGGNGGGELSEAAMESLFTELPYALSQGELPVVETEEQLQHLGLAMLRSAAAHVAEVKSQNPEWQDAGTTITLVIAASGLLGVFWIGDSPAVLYHAGRIEQLVEPLHTLLELLVAEGQPRTELASQQGLSSTLTRCAGHDRCEPDCRIVKLRGPSLCVIGSDGLFSFITEDQLAGRLRKTFATCFSARELARDLACLAIDNGSDDNVTALVSLLYPHHAPRKTVHRKTQLITR